MLPRQAHGWAHLISDITDIETIAMNGGIRDLARLRKRYGAGRWRKRKGVATVLRPDGTPRIAELHQAVNDALLHTA